MNIVTFDLGSFSVKILAMTVEGNQTILRHASEILVNDILKIIAPDSPLHDVHEHIVKNFLEESNFEGKFIFQFPQEELTTRFLEIPISQKKKAELTIPFQLEDNIPYPLEDTHYSYALYKKNDGYNALIQLTRKESFASYYRKLTQREILPNVLTTELGVYNTIRFSKDDLPESFAVIDLGHKNTTGHFFFKNRVISGHRSSIAGHMLDDIISGSYQISKDEARIYKHKNCFFLTRKLYEKVDQDQKDFGLLMERIFEPLILDIKRWDLGHRVKTGQSLDKIYLTGGTSHIKNINNYFAQELEIPCEFLALKDQGQYNSLAPIDKRPESYSQCILMGNNWRKENCVINMLTGEFIGPKDEDVSVHSLFFLLNRSMAFLLLMGFLLIGPMFLFESQKKELIKTVSQILKNAKYPLLKDKYPKFKTYVRSNPELLLDTLKEEYSKIQSRIKASADPVDVTPVSSFLNLTQLISDFSSFEISSYAGNQRSQKVRILSKDVVKLKNLETKIKAQGLLNYKSDLDSKNKVLLVEFKEMK